MLSFIKLIAENNLDKVVAICKELTKINEIIFRDKVDNIQKKIINKELDLRGEFVLVIDGNKTKTEKNLNIASEHEIKRLLKKFTLTETVDIVHKLTNNSKKEIYKMALKLKND